jgi:hypothetical protein
MENAESREAWLHENSANDVYCILIGIIHVVGQINAPLLYKLPVIKQLTLVTTPPLCGSAFHQT